ncbi:MAG: metallophosphoesterase family protein [Thermodesulfobacteriota bacterium]
MSLIAGWAFGWLASPLRAWGTAPKLRLALLADAHLKNGHNRSPEAQALARAVAEISFLSEPPDLVLFAGDLAHKGRPDALDLGREILSGLTAPVWAVRGEGDCGRGGVEPWVRRFGLPSFSRRYRGVNFLGLDTARCKTHCGPAFELGAAQRQWLLQELARLDSDTPLVIISHAPLPRIFYPWQQWTRDAMDIAPLLGRFSRLLCLHGHVHGTGVVNAGASKAGIWSQWPVASIGNDGWEVSFTANRQPPTATRLLSISLPASAWPCPQPIQGTPAILRPGLGPRNCGWGLVTLGPMGLDFQPRLWQA